MNVARLNFSHGDHAEHRAMFEVIRAVSAELGAHVGILQDLQGPKIRTGPIAQAPLQLVAGSPFTISTLAVPGTEQSVSTTFSDLPNDVKPGDRILLADGAVELTVLTTTRDSVRCRVVIGGSINSNAGISLPGVAVSAPSLTDKDIDDLRFGLELGVDFVALSFVRRPEDVVRAKELVAAAGKRVPVIAKLEKPEAIARLDEILAVSDGVMVARGDLGVELSAEQVPFLQKQIIAAANRRGIPVITATQMLESMIEHARPTRAEASDVANAIFDGTDAVMLSAETAIGQYPVETVAMMARIAAEADRHFAAFGHEVDPVVEPRVFAQVIAEAAKTAVSRLNAAAIVARTRSGFTARLVSKFRPDAPILAATADEAIARQLSLLWGIVPIVVPNLGTLSDLVAQIDAGEIAADFVSPGDNIVLTGSTFGAPHPGETNSLRFHRVTAR
jgi:pyruvate kinase